MRLVSACVFLFWVRFFWLDVLFGFCFEDSFRARFILQQTVDRIRSLLNLHVFGESSNKRFNQLERSSGVQRPGWMCLDLECGAFWVRFLLT